MVIKLIISTIIICLILPLSMTGAKERTIKPTGKINYKTLLNFSVGYPTSIQSASFINEYHNNLGGTLSEIKYKVVAGMALKVYFFEHLRFSLSADFLTGMLSESYIFYPPQYQYQEQQDISQKIELTNIPILFSIEYTPVFARYKTYAGIGFGMNFGKIKWNESIFSTIEHDKRIGGTHYNESCISPAFQINAGVELGFDRTSEIKILEGIFLEFRYTHIFQSVPIFNKIRKQFEPVPENWNNNYALIPGYIALNFGLTLNINALQGKI